MYASTLSHRAFVLPFSNLPGFASERMYLHPMRSRIPQLKPGRFCTYHPPKPSVTPLLLTPSNQLTSLFNIIRQLITLPVLQIEMMNGLG